MYIANKRVKLHGIKSELLFGISIVDSVYFQFYGESMGITSACETDTKHSVKSLHYCGSAIDFVRPDLEEHNITPFVRECQIKLGDEFDFIDEKDHLHLEYQPKFK